MPYRDLDGRTGSYKQTFCNIHDKLRRDGVILNRMPNREKKSVATQGIHLVADDRREAFILFMTDLIRRAKAGEISVSSVTEYDFGPGKNKFIEIAFDQETEKVREPR